MIVRLHAELRTHVLVGVQFGRQGRLVHNTRTKVLASGGEPVLSPLTLRRVFTRFHSDTFSGVDFLVSLSVISVPKKPQASGCGLATVVHVAHCHVTVREDCCMRDLPLLALADRT